VLFRSLKKARLRLIFLGLAPRPAP